MDERDLVEKNINKKKKKMNPKKKQMKEYQVIYTAQIERLYRLDVGWFSIQKMISKWLRIDRNSKLIHSN